MNGVLTKSWLKVVVFAIVSVTSCFVSITPDESDDVIAAIVLPQSQRAARECVDKQIATGISEGSTSTGCNSPIDKIEISYTYASRYTPIALTAFPIRP